MIITELGDNFQKRSQLSNIVAVSIDMIQHLGKGVSAAKSEEEVFFIMEDKVEALEANVSCLILKLDEHKNLLAPKERFIKNKVLSTDVIEPVEEFYKTVIKTKEPLLIEDIRKGNPEKYKNLKITSLFLVPLELDGDISAITAFFHTEEDYFIEVKRKFYEVVSFNAAGVLEKIYQNNFFKEREEVREKLINQKDVDLELSIETIAEQYSELKHHQKKQEALMQEVYHRVSNNLQIISSILRLYINDDTKEVSADSFKEVYDRVQVMALVHQNVYKNMGDGSNGMGVESFLRDLSRYIAGVSDRVALNVYPSTSVDYISHDTLVSISLLIAEIYYFLRDQAISQEVENISTELIIDKKEGSSNHFVTIVENGALKLGVEDNIFDKTSGVNYILISALTDQISATIEHDYGDKNEVKIAFDI